MTIKSMSWRLPAVLIAAATLAACSVTVNLSDQGAGVFRALDEDAARIVTDFDTYANASRSNVGFSYRVGYEEYALFRSPEGQAEVVFLEVPDRRQNRHSLEFNKLISSTLPMWRFHQNQDLQLRDSVSVQGRVAQTWMQPFRQVVSGRECVGFYSSWDENTTDPQIRPTRTMFGYHCNVAGTPLTDMQARAFIASLDIRGISIPLQPTTVYAANAEQETPPRETQIAQMVVAQDGVAGGVSGTPEFPFLVVREFPIGDRCFPGDC